MVKPLYSLRINNAGKHRELSAQGRWLAEAAAHSFARRGAIVHCCCDGVPYRVITKGAGRYTRIERLTNGNAKTG